MNPKRLSLGKRHAALRQETQVQEPPDDGPTEHHSDTVEGVLHLLGLGRLDLERLSFVADRHSMKLKRVFTELAQQLQGRWC